MKPRRNRKEKREIISELNFATELYKIIKNTFPV